MLVMLGPGIEYDEELRSLRIESHFLALALSNQITTQLLIYREESDYIPMPESDPDDLPPFPNSSR